MSIKSLVPNLMVEDVSRSARFWCDLLGFHVNMCVDEAKGFHREVPEGASLIWAQFMIGEVELMVQRRDSLSEELPKCSDMRIGGTFTLYLVVSDLDAMYEKLKGSAPTVKDVHTTFYGMREWYLADPDGYVVCLAQQA